MKYHTIARTDLKVSKICLGTMNMGQQNNEAQAHEQLDYAVGEGVNFIDCAEVYPIPPDRDKQGDTERFVGSWLKKRGRRDDLIITSKVATSPAITTRDNAQSYSKEAINAAIEGSLERLGVDYIDLYQVHWPEREMNRMGVRGVVGGEAEGMISIEETLGALDELVKSGKVRHVGVSNESPWGVFEYLRLHREKDFARIVTIQNQYSLINRSFEIGLSEFALKEGVELLAYSPLSMGVLTGKYLGGALPPNARFTIYERNRERYNAPHNQPAIEAYVDIAKKHNLSPAQMALAFVNSRPFVAANIIGATNLDQLKENIASVDVKLTAEVLADIDAVYKIMPDPQP